MSEATYALVFQGDVLAGFERDAVMRQFGELFGLAEADVQRVFGHPRVVLKRNLSEAAAQSFFDRLTAIGMAVALDASAAPAVSVSAPATPVPASGADSGATPAPAAAVAAPLQAVASAATAAIPPLQPLAPVAATPQQVAGDGGAGGVGDHAAALRAEGGARRLPFEFTGNGTEFFRIWIVNILLTIVTLGIYSAWAKVRTQRYFYGNTRLDDSSFEYLADPIRILKGRLVAFAMLVVYMFADAFVPLLGALLMLVFVAIFPWIMVRGLSFRNHYSAWRGVRFGFDGGLGDAYKVFLLWPLLGVLTLGLLLPYALCRQQHFIIGNGRYGVEPFRFSAGAASFYLVFLALFGLTVVGGIVIGVLGIALPLLMIPLWAAIYLAAFALYNVMMTNLRFNHSALATHRLEADYKLGSYAWLMFTNTLFIVLTLGLFFPWARVRNARYAAQHIALQADGDLDAFAARQRDEISAAGGEIADLFDVDLGV
jgi:uncharacterized membrane protein YjgN (DUF898 family)